MNERAKQRSELRLTQSSAAAAAGVSLATWRRWELAPESVSADTRAACEAVLAGTRHPKPANPTSAFVESWTDSALLTPRQAYAIAAELDYWADAELGEWLLNPSQALHEIAPCNAFDLRVMMLVADNRAWAEAVRRRCQAVSIQIASGVLPGDQPGPMIDELVLAAALDGAAATLHDMPELFVGLPVVAPMQSDFDAEDEWPASDDEWTFELDDCIDRATWNWSNVLDGSVSRGDPHPFSWFDVA